MKKNRAKQIKIDTPIQSFSRVLKDIDTSILQHLEQTIIPNITMNNEMIKVPIIYGTPERWKSIQKDRFYRDKNGKAQFPLIMFKRTNEEIDRDKLRNIDANKSVIHKNYIRQYSNKNNYTLQTKLYGQTDIPDIYQVVIPDYVTLIYDAVIWTQYAEHMNTIKEALIYAESSYWGKQNEFKCYTVISGLSDSSELSVGQDRLISSTFSMTVKSHLIPETIQKQIQSNSKKQLGIYKQVSNVGLKL